MYDYSLGCLNVFSCNSFTPFTQKTDLWGVLNALASTTYGKIRLPIVKHHLFIVIHTLHILFQGPSLEARFPWTHSNWVDQPCPGILQFESVYLRKKCWIQLRTILKQTMLNALKIRLQIVKHHLFIVIHTLIILFQGPTLEARFPRTHSKWVNQPCPGIL